MPQPTISDVHVNVPLTNLTLSYEQMDDAFVADKVFPILPVPQRSDVYYKYNRGDFTRNTMQKRAAGTESAGGGYRMDNTGTYMADVWSLHKDVPDQIRANADAMLSLDMDATRYLTQQARLNREIQWASAFFSAGKWTVQVSGVASGETAGGPNSLPYANGATLRQWNDAGSTPIQDIRNMKQVVQLAGLYRANKIVFSRPLFDALCDHPDLVDRLKYGQTAPQPAKVTLAAMAALFELDEVLVMDGIQNIGQETINFSSNDLNQFIAGKNALLVYTPESAGLLTPCAGLTFAWTGYLGATAYGTRIKSFYLPWLESTRVEIDNAFAHQIVGPDLGCFFQAMIP
jgi:hypothetical protein